MKTLLNNLKRYALLFVALLFSVAIFAADGDPEPVNFWHSVLPTIVAIVAGVYEVVVRVIPSISNLSWIAKLLDILVWISDFLNRKKK